MEPLDKTDSQTCEYPPRFGMMAVRLGFITAPQLREALIEQVNEDIKGSAHRKIGDILLGRGWMSKEQVEETLRKTLQCYPSAFRKTNGP